MIYIRLSLVILISSIGEETIFVSLVPGESLLQLLRRIRGLGPEVRPSFRIETTGKYNKYATSGIVESSGVTGIIIVFESGGD